MRFKLLLLMMMVPTMALADKSFTEQDVVGDWLCTHKDAEANPNRTELMSYYADGTAIEMMQDSYRYSDFYYDAIETVFLKYRWRLEGNRLYMSDYQLLNYWYHYQFDGIPIQSDEIITTNMKADFLSAVNKNNWHYMAFDSKDKHRYTFEDGFSVDCQRLK